MYKLGGEKSHMEVKEVELPYLTWGRMDVVYAAS
jgi:hypothetical protein